MEKPLKIPKKGAVARVREKYKELTRRRPVPAALKDALIQEEQSRQDRPARKRIARSDSDLETP